MKKRIYILTVCLILSLAYMHAQNNNFSFSETTFDFGTIGDKDGRVNHDFIITNNSNEPLIITRVNASCGCTSPDWTKEPIEPGKSGKVAVSYNPAGNSGQVSKTVRVTTNLEPTTTVLYIRANVEKGNLDPSTTYPKNIGTILFKTNPMLDFGQISSKESKSIKLEAYNDSENSLSTATAFNLPSYITVDKENLPAKSRVDLIFTFNAENYKEYGMVKQIIPINGLDNNKSSVKGSIVVHAFINENFDNLTPEQKKQMGRINLNKKEISFFKSKKDNFEILKISNSGKSDLHIKAFQATSSDISFPKNNITIKPNEIRDIKISYPVNKIKNPETATIYIISDDPNNSVKEIKVVVNP